MFKAIYKYSVFMKPVLHVFSVITGKYGPKEIRILTLFTQWLKPKTHFHNGHCHVGRHLQASVLSRKK